jgi:GNAT superfamily N-acetyltransferase
MTEIPDAVRRQALHPFRELPSVPGFERIDHGTFIAWLHAMPMAQLVEPLALSPDDVRAAVEEARAIVRAHGRSLLIWMIGSDQRRLGLELEQLGLVNADTPGFEAVENAMALLEPPAGATPTDVSVVEVDSYESFAASQRVIVEAFGVTAEMRDEMEQELPKRYDEYMTPGNPMRQLNALLDGRVVGTAGAAVGPAGINLFGGSVLPAARGRGVYRALTRARWDIAVALGTPALTIQAGRMSRPIVERLGFQFIDTVAVYVDDFS